MAENMPETLFFMKFIQAKPQVKSQKKNYYDLFYTTIKNLTDGGGEIMGLRKIILGFLYYIKTDEK